MHTEVVRLVADTLWLDPRELRTDRCLVEYGVDSVRSIDLMVALEERFGVQIADEDVARLQTVDDIVEYVTLA